MTCPWFKIDSIWYFLTRLLPYRILFEDCLAIRQLAHIFTYNWNSSESWASLSICFGFIFTLFWEFIMRTMMKFTLLLPKFICLSYFFDSIIIIRIIFIQPIRLFFKFKSIQSLAVLISLVTAHTTNFFIPALLLSGPIVIHKLWFLYRIKFLRL